MLGILVIYKKQKIYFEHFVLGTYVKNFDTLAQTQLNGTAVDRLVNKTALEEPGWIRIKPLVRLFNKYNVDPNQIELEKTTVYHPCVVGNGITFQAALQQNMVIVALVIKNTMTSVNFPPEGFSLEENSPHAVTIFGYDQLQNVFQIKNSYFAEKMITINANSQFPVYSDFRGNSQLPQDIQQQIQQFRQLVPQRFPNFTDQSYILADVGYCVRFRDKSQYYFFSFSLLINL